jgi:catechol 2,3-dioxygenase-like lactoylglutathione lyase family enzyme
MGFDQQVTFLPVNDLVRSMAFYGEVLGLTHVLDQGDCQIYRVASEAFLGVCLRPGHEPSDGLMITLVTDDVDGWHEVMTAAGVVCDKAPAIHPKYQLHHAFYRDPDGHIIEIQTFLDPQWPRPR